MSSIRKASGGWYSGASQIARACWAQASGKSISHKSEWHAARGWRLGAIIHRLKTDYGWPIRTEYRGPENIAYYSLPEHVDRASLRFPRSAREVAEEWGCGMNRLQILYLRRLHWLTEAQAQAIAALIWGACQ